MAITPRQMICPASKKQIKYPYPMNPTRIVVHNTYNNASADAEVRYMNNNNNTVSFHFAVDDKEVVQGIPLNCNAWHAGDGGSGAGNRQGIAIEICYSKSGGARFVAAEKLAAQFIAQLLKERGWGLERVTKHQDYSGKYCPHRTLDMGWARFLKMVESYLSPEITRKYKAGNKVYYSSCYKGPNDPESKALMLNSSYFGGKFKSGTIIEIINDGKSVSLVDALASLNIDFSFSYRSKIAKANGIANYTGSATQNTKMLNLLKAGELIKP